MKKDMMATKRNGGCTGCLFAPFHGLYLFYFKYGFWVFRLLAPLVAFWVLVGIALLWRVPLTASRNDVDQFDLLVRCLDCHQAEPLYPLKGYQEATDPARIPFRQRERIGKIDTVRKGPHHYEHTLFSRPSGNEAARPLGTVTSTTPHTRVPPAELQDARQRIEALYPPWDQASWDTVRKWGEGLFVRWWATEMQLLSSPEVHNEPARGTEEEHLWFAWQRLRAATPQAAEDFPRLGDLARLAFPDEDDYQAALAWARTFHSRQEDYFQNHRARRRALDGERFKDLGEVALPRPTETTLWWLVYQYAGLTDASRKAARGRWLSYFASDKAELALRWGSELEKQRREDKEPLPPIGDNVALLCVIERLEGTDAYGDRCRRATADVLAPVDWGKKDAWILNASTIESSLKLAIQFAYPNDDLFYLVAAGDPLQLYGLFGFARSSEGNHVLAIAREIIWLLIWLLLACLVLRGLRTWILVFLGRWLLLLRWNPRFKHYYEKQTRFDWKGAALAYVLTPLGLWGVAWYTLSPHLELMMPTPYHLLAGVFTAVVLGGTLILCMNRLVAIFLIRLEWDLEKTWLDEILGLILGVVLLRYFGNDYASIAAFVAFAIIPEVMNRKKPIAARSTGAAAAVPEAVPAGQAVLGTPAEPSAEPVVTLTRRAAEEVRRILAEMHSEGAVVRVYLKNTGGQWSYGLDLDPVTTREDWHGEFHGVTVVVEAALVPSCRGLTVDFKPEAPGFTVTAAHPDQRGSPPPGPPAEHSPVVPKAVSGIAGHEALRVFPLAEIEPDERSRAMQELQGVWTLVTFFMDGRQCSREEFSKFPTTLVFVGNKITFVIGAGEATGCYTVDPTSNPKGLDLF
jgi:Fe-S cluster assembly iron-binding protein IscA